MLWTGAPDRCIVLPPPAKNDGAGSPELDIGALHASQGFSRRSARPRIIAAARQLFRAGGAEIPPIQDVAAASGLSRRAVYNHFRDPQQLRIALLHSYFEEVAEQIPPEIPRHIEPGSAIPSFLDSCSALMASEPYVQMSRLMIAAARLEPATASAYLRNVRQPLARPLEIYLLHRKLAGEFRRCEPRSISLQVIAMVEAAALMPALLGTSESARAPRPPAPGWIATALLANRV